MVDIVVAAGQTTPIAGHVSKNTQQHIRLTKIAADCGVNILVFPELSLTGYELTSAKALAFSPNDSRLDDLRAAARISNIFLVVGGPLLWESHLYIAAFILEPKGEVRIYTKRHLGAFSDSARVDGIPPPPESSIFSPGTLDPDLSCRGYRAHIAICADMGHPQHAESAAARGAQLYLGSLFVIPSLFAEESLRARKVAQRHNMTVVFSNFGGESSGGLSAAGRSAIYSPKGEVISEMGGRSAGLVWASIKTQTGQTLTL